MFGLWLIGILIILNVSHQAEILSDEKDICRLFPDDTKIRKPGYCNQMIECQNHVSVDKSTCENFVTTKGVCVKTTTDTYCSDPCKPNSPTFVADTKNCEGWYKCNGQKSLGSGYCPNHMHFNTTSQSCVYSSVSTCVATYGVCDVAPTGIQYKDEEHCNMYYICENSLINGIQPVSYECPDGNYFDADSGQCIAKSLVPCDKHPYPADVCGTKKLPKRDVFVSDGATCRGYYYCKDPGTGPLETKPTWGQCELDKFFKESTQVCLSRNYVVCDEDRCDGRESGKELSGTYGCRNYLICKNNATVSEEYCGSTLYFNAEKEECTPQKISYPACS